MKIQIIALASLLLCSACDDYEPEGPIPYDLYESYIIGYFDLDEISARAELFFTVNDAERIFDNSDMSKYDPNKTSYRISDGIGVSMRVSSIWIYDTAGGEITKRYKVLRDELGDTSFNTELSRVTRRPSALTGMIDGIRITVNEDYAAKYPAGADVSALFTIFYEHPYAVIQNNYQSPENTYRYSSIPSELPQAVYKDNLSTVELSGKKALGPDFDFLLNGAPAKSGNYTFTIEVQTAEGKVLTATTKPIPITVP